MSVLGIRCSSYDFHYAILKGTQKTPQVIKKDHILYPKGYSIAPLLKWFLQEMEDLINKDEIKSIVMRGTEAMARQGSPFVKRIEMESMVYLAGANLGIRHIKKKVMSTIAKGLGLKGKAKYVWTNHDTSLIAGFDTFHKNMQEAILAGWSELH